MKTRSPNTRPPHYACFISYKHGQGNAPPEHRGDTELARLIHRNLHRIARPFWRLRALHAFRDEAELAAGADLPGRIRSALSRSAHLLLITSPQAAASKWVNQEVSEWLTHDPTGERLIVAVTEGDLNWSSGSDHGRLTGSAVPPALTSTELVEPKWIDLRPFRAAPSSENHELRATVLAIAARLHGTTPDALASEDARRLRQTIVAMAVGMAALIGATTFAFVQRSTAQTQSRLARSRELAALGLATDYRDRGLLLAEAAYRVSPTVEARSALLRQLAGVRFARVFLHGYRPGVLTVDLGHGGDRVAAGGYGGRILVWDLASPARPQWTLEPPAVPDGIPDPDRIGNRTHAVRFLPGGDVLLAAYEWGSPQLWRLTDHTARPVAGWPAPTSGTQRVSTDWEGADPEPPAIRGARPVTCIAIDAARNRALLGDFAGRVFAVDLDTARVTWTIQLDLRGVAAIAVLPQDGSVVVADGSGQLRWIDPQGRRTRPEPKRPHSSRLTVLRALPEPGTLLTLDSLGTLVRWVVRRGELTVADSRTLPLLPKSAEVSPRRGLLFAAAMEGDLRAFAAGTSEALTDADLRGHRMTPLAVRCDDETSRCASGGVGGEVIVWDLDQHHALRRSTWSAGELVVGLRRSGAGTVEVLTQPDGALAWTSLANAGRTERHSFKDLRGYAIESSGDAVALSFGDGRVTLYGNRDFTGPIQLRQRAAASNVVARLWISARAQLIVGDGARAGRFRVWRRDEPSTTILDVSLPSFVSSVVFSADGRRLYAGLGNGVVLTWDLEQPSRRPADRQVASGPVFALAMSTDKRVLFAGSGAGDRRIRALDSQSLAEVRALPERHTSSLSDLLLTPDGKTLVSIGQDGLAVLWDLESGREIGPLPHGSGVTLQAAVLDGPNLLITADERHVMVHDIGDAGILAAACRVANRRLSPAEWTETVGGNQPATGCAMLSPDINIVHNP